MGTGWRFPGLGWIFRTWLLPLKVASSLEGVGWLEGAEPGEDEAWFVWGRLPKTQCSRVRTAWSILGGQVYDVVERWCIYGS